MWNEKSLPYSLKYAIPYKDTFFKSTYVGKFLMEHMLGAPMNSLKGKEPGDGLGAVFSYLNVNGMPDRHDTYEMSVPSSLCNLLGRMQGGALAMAVEQSAIMYHAADSRRRIVGMDVRYHGASKVSKYYSLLYIEHVCHICVFRDWVASRDIAKFTLLL
jgi:hypothetical protein